MTLKNILIPHVIKNNQWFIYCQIYSQFFCTIHFGFKFDNSHWTDSWSTHGSFTTGLFNAATVSKLRLFIYVFTLFYCELSSASSLFITFPLTVSSSQYSCPCFQSDRWDLNIGLYLTYGCFLKEWLTAVTARCCIATQCVSSSSSSPTYTHSGQE